MPRFRLLVDTDSIVEEGEHLEELFKDGIEAETEEEATKEGLSTTSCSYELVPCETDEEKEEERKRWKMAISTILPSSFRIGKDLPICSIITVERTY